MEICCNWTCIYFFVLFIYKGIHVICVMVLWFKSIKVFLSFVSLASQTGANPATFCNKTLFDSDYRVFFFFLAHWSPLHHKVSQTKLLNTYFRRMTLFCIEKPIVPWGSEIHFCDINTPDVSTISQRTINNK